VPLYNTLAALGAQLQSIDYPPFLTFPSLVLPLFLLGENDSRLFCFFVFFIFCLPPSPQDSLNAPPCSWFIPCILASPSSPSPYACGAVCVWVCPFLLTLVLWCVYDLGFSSISTVYMDESFICFDWWLVLAWLAIAYFPLLLLFFWRRFAGGNLEEILMARYSVISFFFLSARSHLFQSTPPKNSIKLQIMMTCQDSDSSRGETSRVE
jgi:hypothetical protein